MTTTATATATDKAARAIQEADAATAHAYRAYARRDVASYDAADARGTRLWAETQEIIAGDGSAAQAAAAHVYARAAAVAAREAGRASVDADKAAFRASDRAFAAAQDAAALAENGDELPSSMRLHLQQAAYRAERAARALPDSYRARQHDAEAISRHIHGHTMGAEHRLGDAHPSIPGLRRLIAGRDIPRHCVKRGDIGGWVQNVDQVSDEGWVADEAQVTGRATVRRWAVVRDRATVAGNADVAGFTVVEGDATVAGDATVDGFARIGGHADIGGSAEVAGVILIDGDDVLR